jgi:hypothetical protein
MKLTARQLKFAAEYAISSNAADAARKAGYSANGAKVTGCRLLTFPNLQAAIAVARQQEAIKLDLRKEAVIAGLIDAYNMAKAQRNPSAMVRSAAEIGKLCGFYDAEVVKTPISQEGERMRRKFAEMSDDELAEIAAGRMRVN